MAGPLPPLPDHASGVLCTRVDNINRTNTDFMREKIQTLIAQKGFRTDTYRLSSTNFEIGITANLATHANVQLIGPDSQVIAGLDTQHIDRKTGEILNYFPGGNFAAPVLDDCPIGDSVAIEGKRVGRIDLVKGTGPEALLAFAKAAERSVFNSERNYDYFGRPDPTPIQNQANSNAFARSQGKIFGMDIGPTFHKQASLSALEIFGINTDTGMGTDLTTRPYPRSKYEGITAEEFMNNPAHLENLYKDLQQLHPVVQQQRAMNFGQQPSTRQVLEPVTP